MDGVEWSRCMAGIFFAHGDPTNEMRKFRNFIPSYVLQSFCSASDHQMWLVYDQNQVPNLIGNNETLMLYHPDTQGFEKRLWSESFGEDNIYHSFFDGLTTETWMRDGFRKFEVLQRVDRDVFHGLADPIWQIMQQQLGTRSIMLHRQDLNTFRKHLYLLTSVQNRNSTMHLLAHDERMEDARVRRRKHVETFDMEHPRDVWLRNSQQILDTPHHAVSENREIFDLDREDYRANARERFMVFWEAPPGEEFLLTDSSFGGFEGGQIGDKKNSQINMSQVELEQHIYTRDFMWHQLFVLSPTLMVALCHGSLMHPETTKLQRKRWGVRRSLLESLPHSIPLKYYKDMAKPDVSFTNSFTKSGYTLPSEVERAFSGNDPKSISHQKRGDDELVFPIHSLLPTQVALVNSVLLHNQQRGPQIKSICLRDPSTYQSLYQSLLQFRHNPWGKYSTEKQNNYDYLLERLNLHLNPMPPPDMHAALHYTTLQQPAQPMHPHQIPPPSMFDPRQVFGDMRYLSASEIPRYDPTHVDAGRPVQIRALSAHSTQSSLTSSFTPSSQSSYSHSSASSQSSNSTATTSVDTPRFDPKPVPPRRHSPIRREQPLAQRSQHNETVTRGSDSSGKSQRSKAERAQPPKNLNIVIEHTIPGISEQNVSRGRQPEPTRTQPTSASSSKKSSPNPSRAELDLSPFERTQLPALLPAQSQSIPQTHPSRAIALPERPSYVVDPVRPRGPERARTETQASTGPSRMPNNISLNGQENGTGRHYEPKQNTQPQQYRSPERLPQRVEAQPPVSRNFLPSQDRQKVEQPQTKAQRRVNRSPERQPFRQDPQPMPSQRSTATSQDRQSYRFESLPQGLRSADRSPERQPQQNQRTAAGSQDRQSQRSDRHDPPNQAHRNLNSSNDRTSHVPESASSRRYEPVRAEQPLMPQRTLASSSSESSSRPSDSRGGGVRLEPQPQLRSVNRSPERTKIEAQSQGTGSGTSERPSHISETARGHAYEVVKPEQPQPQPSTKPTAVSTKVPQRQPSQRSASQAQPQAQGQPPSQQLSQGQSSRNTSTSTEHSMRPGVELVRGRPTVPQLPPAPPCIVEQIHPRPANASAAATKFEGAPNGGAPIENAKIKQLRFQEGVKGVSHKLSDMSLAGSMVVEIGDRAKEQATMMEEDDEEEDDASDDDDDASWEDEGFAEAEEVAAPRKPVVRFADKPMPRAGLIPGTKHHIIERPNSRLGRRVEIPSRPLSRNGQNRFEQRKARFTNTPAHHGLRREN